MNSPTRAELRGINLKTKIITDAEHRGIKPLKGIKRYLPLCKIQDFEVSTPGMKKSRGCSCSSSVPEEKVIALHANQLFPFSF